MDTREQFNQLRKKLLEQNRVTSSVHEMISRKPLKEILRADRKFVPFILEDFANNSKDCPWIEWSYALSQIFKIQHTFNLDDQGRYDRIIARWLEWAKENFHG